MGKYVNLSRQLQATVPRLAENKIREVFEATAQAVYDWIDSQQYFTNRSGNLKDSIGVAMYRKGVLLDDWYWLPAKGASKELKTRYHGADIVINGREMLNEAIDMGGSLAQEVGDYTLVVFVAAPHGAWVTLGLGSPDPANEFKPTKKGFGWWQDGLRSYATQTFIQNFNRVFK